jgi:integrase
MSVYRRKGAATFTFDFWLQGHRFSGDTGKTSKREARAAEGLERDRAKKHVGTLAQLDAPRTWGEASTRWFNEVGQHHVNIEQTLLALAWLEKHIGKGKLLTAIDDNFVAGLVAKRRLEKRRGKGWKRDEMVSPATVNRTATEPMRKVFLRAQKVWRVPVGEVDWAKHMLAEPQERVREATEEQEAGIMAGLDRGYDVAAEFLFINGLRQMEVVGMLKQGVNFFGGGSFAVTGKGGKTRVIPMTARSREILWDLKDSDGEFVFGYIAARTDRRKKLVKGRRYPLTRSGLRTALRRAISGAGVDDFHPHDIRHTAATRVLRGSNIRVVQRMLGHADLATTGKYAHAMVEDVRAAMEAATPSKSPVELKSADAKVLGDK